MTKMMFSMYYKLYDFHLRDFQLQDVEHCDFQLHNSEHYSFQLHDSQLSATPFGNYDPWKLFYES